MSEMTSTGRKSGRGSSERLVSESPLHPSRCGEGFYEESKIRGTPFAKKTPKRTGFRTGIRTNSQRENSGLRPWFEARTLDVWLESSRCGRSECFVPERVRRARLRPLPRHPPVHDTVGRDEYSMARVASSTGFSVKWTFD